jgi:hypothetical protein
LTYSSQQQAQAQQQQLVGPCLAALMATTTHLMQMPWTTPAGHTCCSS